MKPHPIGNGYLAPRIPREFAALMDALQLKGANTDALLALSNAEWDKLLDLCDLAHLTLALAQVTPTGFPKSVTLRLKANVADNALRFTRVRVSYLEAASALQNARVPHLVLKGFTQCPDYVSDPRFRMQSDLDFYCPQDQIPKATAALEGIGYAPSYRSNGKLSDHVPTLSRPGNWEWNGNMYDPDMPVSIDLHFCLWNDASSLIGIPEVKRFWTRRVIRQFDDFSFPALNVVDQLGYFALHILRGIFLGDWIVHHVRELAVFLHHHVEDVSLWTQWEKTHSVHQRNLEAIAFSLAEKWFSCTLPQRVRQQVDSLPAVQKGWIERFGGSPLQGMFRRTKDGKLLQLLLAESWAAKQEVLRRAVFPVVISAPDTPAVRIKNRKEKGPGSLGRNVDYVAYLGNRLFSHASATSVFLIHGMTLWLSQRALRSQFWLYLAAAFFFELGLSAYFFLFNLFLIGHGYNESQLGFLTSAMAAGNLAGALPAGWLIQRAGLRRALMVCLLTATAILSARSLLLTVPLQLILAFTTGTTLSLWAVCISPAIAETTGERERPFAFSLFFSVGIGVGALGALAASRMPGWFAGVPAQFHLPAPDQLTLIASCFFAALGILPAAALTLSHHSIPSRALPLFSPALKRFLPAVALWGLVTGSFTPFANVYLAVHLRLPLHKVGTIFSISQLAQVGAVLCAPFVFRLYGLKAGIISAQFATSMCFVFLAMSNRPVIAASVYIALTAFQWMNEPGLYSLLIRIVPEEQRGGASASMSFALSSTQLLAAASAGWAFAHLGYPLVLSTIALIATIAAGTFRSVRLVDASPAPPCLAETGRDTSATEQSDVARPVSL